MKVQFKDVVILLFVFEVLFYVGRNVLGNITRGFRVIDFNRGRHLVRGAFHVEIVLGHIVGLINWLGPRLPSLTREVEIFVNHVLVLVLLAEGANL